MNNENTILKQETYYLTKSDLQHLENNESIDIMTVDHRHIQILLEVE